jgi:hypothetical protein
VAPRLIPPDPEFRSQAERTLWRRLKAKLPPDALLAANVRLGSHDDFYEADLVVGLPGQGFAVIEVKGGQVDHTDAGWVQYTPAGPKPIDPAGQADRAKRLLDSYLRARGWSHGPIRFEHLVAFPDVELGSRPPAPDLPRWQTIAKGDLDDAAGIVWDAIHQRNSDKPVPTAAWVAEAADMIGGRPDPARALLAVGQAREEYVTQLTEAQYRVLDLLRTNDRILVKGGPGTGKTWLALEQARRWAASGDQVLLVCYSIGLSRWMRQAVDAMGEKTARRIHVSTFSAFLVGKGIDVPKPSPGQHWWDVELPALAAPSVSADFDAVVIDEAQDFAAPWWPVLRKALRGERMFVAGDERQSVFPDRLARPPVEAFEVSLDENLRNTSQIVSVLGPLCPERMRHRGGEGPPVRFVPCSTSDAVDTADGIVEELLFARHDPGSIALLTTKHRHPDQLRQEEHLGKPGYWEGFGLGDEVFYATVMGFKGLERPVVVLAVDGFHDNVARDVMYTGMSRARDQLVVVGDLDQIRAACGDEVCRRLTGQ